jgi:hypothetical protein
MENQQAHEKAKRGFAIMNSDQQRRIAAKGGKSAHEQGVAHEWSSDEAREAGRKGGYESARNRGNRSESDGRDDIL